MSIFDSIKDAIFGKPTAASGAAQPATPTSQVDVAMVLTGLASTPAGMRLNWRHSIVDLLKLLGLDSSLEARRQLAHELGYSGSTEDTAAMNMWLHREVMAHVAHGGKVPDELRRHT